MLSVWEKKMCRKMWCYLCYLLSTEYLSFFFLYTLFHSFYYSVLFLVLYIPSILFLVFCFDIYFFIIFQPCCKEIVFREENANDNKLLAPSQSFPWRFCTRKLIMYLQVTSSSRDETRAKKHPGNYMKKPGHGVLCPSHYFLVDFFTEDGRET